MDTLIEKARSFAKEAHKDQVRKTTGAPYIGHPFHVAKILEDAGMPTAVVVAGYLHDTVEDTDVTIEDIEREFGTEVKELVAYNTEEKENTWEERKQHTIDQLKTGTLHQKALVVADKYANLLELKRVCEYKGEDVFRAFKRGRTEQGWYFSGVANSGIENLPKEEVPDFFYDYQNEVKSFFS